MSLLTYLNELLGWKFTNIPCHNAIKDWIFKAGYCLYQEPVEKEFAQSHALIIDESIQLGDQKIMLSLGVNAFKTTEQALCKNDVRVLNISVAPGWDSLGIKEVLKQTQEKLTRPARYVISDNDSKLRKAIGDSNYIHIRDVGHTLALLLKQIYEKDPDFKEFTKAVANLKRYAVLSPASYLLPPRQRTIARFMNLSQTIHWATKIDTVFDSLTSLEQQTFSFIKEHTLMIRELACLFEYINPLLELIKNKGLSKKLINVQLKTLGKKINLNTPRIKSFKKALTDYLKQEKKKLKPKLIYHASSDILESLFGYYKLKKSPNSLNGVTPYILILPLITKMSETKEKSDVNFKQILESIKMKDLEQWRKQYLPLNQTTRRRKKLAA